MTLKERIRRIADELHFDLSDPYTRILATAMAGVEAEEESVNSGSSDAR